MISFVLFIITKPSIQRLVICVFKNRPISILLEYDNIKVSVMYNLGYNRGRCTMLLLEITYIHIVR